MITKFSSQFLRTESFHWWIKSKLFSTLSLTNTQTRGPCYNYLSTLKFSTSSSSPSTSTATNLKQKLDYQFEKIAFIGAGKMSEALLAPLILKNVQPSSRISIHDVSTSTMDRLSALYGSDLKTESSISDCIQNADLVVCAVKPQNCDVVFEELKHAGGEGVGVGEDVTLLSVIAGKPIQSFLDGCGVRKVVRSMPNTPAMIGKGMTVWTCTDNIMDEEKARIKTVLSSFGKAIYVQDESFIDMSTSLSGSGPAYIFMLMEAMIDAGVHMGFSRETATTLVHHTLLGSTLYAMETEEHPAILRNSVTSPAGTTASAMYELENGKFRTVIKDAIWACYRRSLEMGGSDSNVGPGRTMINVVPPPHHAPSGEFVDDEVQQK